MKRIIISILVVIVILSIGLYAGQGNNGNGAPSGPHYNLNIIGMSKAKNVDPEPGTSNGRRIFVLLGSNDTVKSTRIWLTEGPYDVIDYDGTDGEASFQLPMPDPENDGITLYSVYVRGLGKPGGKAKITPGFVEDDGTEWYSVAYVEVERKRGQSKFTNESRNLLYVYVDMDGNGSPERYPLFWDDLGDFFWQYDNNGLKICQLRFYEESTNIN